MSSAPIRKYFDIGPASISSTGLYSGGATGWNSGTAGAGVSVTQQSAVWITGLSQSDDDQGRVGQSINIETLDVRVQVTPDNTLVGHGHLRMIIYSDNELDGVVADPTTEILGPTANSSASGLAMSFLQPGYFGRFHIIEDKNWRWYCTNPASVPAVETNEMQNNLYHESHHDMKGHRVMWDTTNASAITNARKGHIFIVFYFENNTVAAGGIITQNFTNPPGIQLTTRIRYRDT